MRKFLWTIMVCIVYNAGLAHSYKNGQVTTTNPFSNTVTGTSIKPLVNVYGERQVSKEESFKRIRLSLNGNWKCKLDERNFGIAENWYKEKLQSGLVLAIPGCIQSLREIADKYPSAMTQQNSYFSHFWLEKEIDLPSVENGKKYWLNFGGIAPTAHIWVNGNYVSFYDEPQIDACFDITNFVVGNKANRITVLISEQDRQHMGGLYFGGFSWSGLYRDVNIEITNNVHIENFGIENASPDGIAVFSGNIGKNTAEICVNILDKGQIILSKKANCSNEFNLSLDVNSLKKWSPDKPNLYDVEICAYKNDVCVDKVIKRTGFRSLITKGLQILLNNEPITFRGVGHEYFSPYISPIVDKDAIRKRFESMKAYGFNFCRYHTHSPTEEEFSVADEVGIILSSEIALVSNFNKTLPPEKCLTLIEKHILLTKHHPSIGIYCLGNEGSQLMVNSYIEREKAVTGYNLIKKIAPNHLAMIAFGMQGELPELPNDIESPHLWSHNFLWAYDGLSDIPWDAMSSLMIHKPWLIHEYGKFGVWPNGKEDGLYPKNGYKSNLGWQSAEALKEAGLYEYEDQIIKNSRKLASLCNRTIIEGARRQKNNSGYVNWTFFRQGIRSAGFVDDIGQNPDTNPDFFKNGCNAPVALLIDRDFIGRTLRSREDTKIGAFISNFGKNDIQNATLHWSIENQGKTVIEGTLENVTATLGVCTKASDIKVTLPSFDDATHLKFKLALKDKRNVFSENSWDFWVFPTEDKMLSSKIAYDFNNTDYKLTFKNKFSGSVNLRELDSFIRGARGWTGIDIQKTFEVFKPNILVTDHYGDIAKKFLENGIAVMLVDNSGFPQDWYTKASIPELKEEDPARFFTGFRSGWDQGNIATIIHKNKLIEKFPCEDFCDLQFYKMIQGARAVVLDNVMKAVGATGKEVLIRSIAKTRPEKKANFEVQDPQALRVLEYQSSRNIYAMDRVFLAEMKVGSGRLIINTLRIFDDPAGEYLMRQILNAFE
jgi:hypothetical protein